jgi:hypothetical protein
VDAECRIDDGIGGWSDIRVKLSAGTRVQLLETTYDSSLPRLAPPQGLHGCIVR